MPAALTLIISTFNSKFVDRISPKISLCEAMALQLAILIDFFFVLLVDLFYLSSVQLV